MESKYFETEEENDFPIFDIDTLSETKKNRFLTIKSMITEIAEHYGPSYAGLGRNNKKGFIEELMRRYNIGRKAIWRYIRE